MNRTVMTSVTSIEPFGATTISELNFSMRSSFAGAAQTNNENNVRKRPAANARRVGRKRARFIQAAFSLGSRRTGRVEAHLGRFALSRGGHFKELARLEAQHIGKNVGGKLLNLGIEVAHDGVVIAPRVLHG